MAKKQRKRIKNQKENNLPVNFHKKLYNPKAIKSAVNQYQDWADFNVAQKGNYIRVELKNIDKDVKEVIKDEFCNYVLFESKKN